MGPGAEAITWLIVILVAVVLLMIVFVFVRRYYQSESGAMSESAIFSLGDLRRLLKEGRLTQGEYDRLRDHIVATARKQSDAPAGGQKPSDRDDSPGSGLPPGLTGPG